MYFLYVGGMFISNMVNNTLQIVEISLMEISTRRTFTNIHDHEWSEDFNKLQFCKFCSHIKYFLLFMLQVED